MAYTMAQAAGLGLPLAGASDYRPPTPTTTPQMPSQSPSTPATSPSQATGGTVQNIGGALYYVDTGEGTAQQAQEAMQKAAPGINLSVSPLVPPRGATIEERWDASRYVTPEVRDLVVPPTTPMKQITPTLTPTLVAPTTISAPSPYASIPLTASAMVGLMPSTAPKITQLSEDDKRILRGISPGLDPTVKKLNEPEQKFLVERLLEARKERGADMITGETPIKPTQIASATAALGLEKKVMAAGPPISKTQILPGSADTATVLVGEEGKEMTVGEYRDMVYGKIEDYSKTHPVMKVYENGQSWVGLSQKFVDMKQDPTAKITETKPDGTTVTVSAASLSNDQILDRMNAGSKIDIEIPEKTITKEVAAPSFVPRYSLVDTAGSKMVWDKDLGEYKIVSPQGTFKMATEESEYLKGLTKGLFETGSGLIGGVADVTVKPLALALEPYAGVKPGTVNENLARMSAEVKADIKGISSGVSELVQPSVSVKLVEDPLLQRMEAAKYKLDLGPSELKPLTSLVGASEVTLLGSKAGGPIKILDPSTGKERLANVGDLYSLREKYIEEAKKVEGPFGLAKLGFDVEGSAKKLEGTGLAGDVAAFGTRVGGATVEAGYQFGTLGLEQAQRFRERIAQGAKAGGLETGMYAQDVVPSASLQRAFKGERESGIGATGGAAVTGGLYSAFGALAKPAGTAYVKGLPVVGGLSTKVPLPLAIGGVMSGQQLLSGAPAEKVVGSFLGPQVVSGFATTVQTAAPGLTKLAQEVGTTAKDLIAPEVGRTATEWKLTGPARVISEKIPGVEGKPGETKVTTVTTTEGTVQQYSKTGRPLGKVGDVDFISTAKRTGADVQQKKFATIGGEEIPIAAVSRGTEMTSFFRGTPGKSYTILSQAPGEKPLGLFYPEGPEITATMPKPLGLFYPGGAEPGAIQRITTPYQEPLGLFYDKTIQATIGGAGGASRKVTIGSEPQYLEVRKTDIDVGGGIKGAEVQYWKSDPSTGLLYESGVPKKVSLVDLQRAYPELGGRVTVSTTGNVVELPQLGTPRTIRPGEDVGIGKTVLGVSEKLAGLAWPKSPAVAKAEGAGILKPTEQGLGSLVDSSITRISSYLRGEGPLAPTAKLVTVAPKGSLPTTEATITKVTPGELGYGKYSVSLSGTTTEGLAPRTGQSIILEPAVPSREPIATGFFEGKVSLPTGPGTQQGVPSAPTPLKPGAIVAGPQVPTNILGVKLPFRLPFSTAPATTVPAAPAPAPAGGVPVKVSGGQVQLQQMAPLRTSTSTATSTIASIGTMAPPPTAPQVTMPLVAPPTAITAPASMVAPAISIAIPKIVTAAPLEKTVTVSGLREVSSIGGVVPVSKLKTYEEVSAIQIQKPIQETPQPEQIERIISPITITLPKIIEKIQPVRETTITEKITEVVPPVEKITTQPPITVPPVRDQPPPPIREQPPRFPGLGLGGMGGGVAIPYLGAAARTAGKLKKRSVYASLLNVMRAQVAGYEGVSAPTVAYEGVSELNVPTLEQLQGKIGRTFDLTPRPQVITERFSGIKLGTPKLNMGKVLKMTPGKRR